MSVTYAAGKKCFDHRQRRSPHRDPNSLLARKSSGQVLMREASNRYAEVATVACRHSPSKRHRKCSDDVMLYAKYLHAVDEES